MGSGFACVLFAASIRPYNAWSMSVVAKRLDGSRCSLEIGMVVGLGPGHTVLDGDPASLPQMDTARQFSAHACCGQTAGWIKMPLGREVGLGPGHNVLDGDPAPLPQRGTAPNFRSMSVVAKQLDGSRSHLVGGRPRPWPHCVRWGPTSPKGATAPNFWPMSVVAKRLPMSATPEHLFTVCIALVLTLFSSFNCLIDVWKMLLLLLLSGFTSDLSSATLSAE